MHVVLAASFSLRGALTQTTLCQLGAGSPAKTFIKISRDAMFVQLHAQRIPCTIRSLLPAGPSSAEICLLVRFSSMLAHIYFLPQF